MARKTSPLHGRARSGCAGTRTGCAPTLVGEVEFAEWTPTGRLRQPSWRGLRPDKSVRDVVEEKVPGEGS